MKNYEDTTILCEAFHIKKEDLEYDPISFKEDETIAVYIYLKKLDNPICPNCGSIDVVVKEKITTNIKNVITILNWYDEILNYFNNPIGIKVSKAIRERVNSQIKLLINNSRGMSNFNSLRKRVLFYFHEKDKKEFLIDKKMGCFTFVNQPRLVCSNIKKS